MIDAYEGVNRMVLKRFMLASRLAYGMVGGVGYILSPLSWWNDGVVNIPIALAAAKVTNELTGIDLELLFTIYYWLTNFIGLIMLFAGVNGTIRARLKARDMALSLAAATSYTIFMIWLLKLLGWS
jgi:hypothetical protein